MVEKQGWWCKGSGVMSLMSEHDRGVIVVYAARHAKGSVEAAFPAVV